MRLLTLPLRLWFVTLTVLVIFFSLSLGNVESGDLEDHRRQMGIEAAMQEMGPMYFYRVLWTGELQVNKFSGDDLDKRWERLGV